MSTLNISRRFSLRKFFVRGESLVATTGMAFVAILALAVGGVVWVSARTIDDSVVAQWEEQVRQTSNLIASQAELRLSDGDVAGVRRLLLDAAASGIVEECEIEVPGYGIIASSSSGQSVLEQLPESWSSVSSVTSGIIHDEAAHKTVMYEPLLVHGQAGISLKLVVDQTVQVIGSDSIRASSVGIASVGLVLMLMVYRRFRNRLGALAAIGEALKAVATGERRTACLLVGESLGVEAYAWNTLLNERDEFEGVRVEQEIVHASQAGGSDAIGLSSACNTLTQGVVLVDADMRVLYANGAASVFLRVSRDDLVDKNFSDISGFSEIADLVAGVLLPHEAARQVMELGDVSGPDAGNAVLRVVVTRVSDEGTTSALVYIEDVTQQRLADESQNAFVAQATHELRTPLTTIRLYTEEAIDADDDDGDIREQALNVINSETRRLERIVGDMLCVAEIEAGALSIHNESVRTEQLVKEIQEDYKAQAKSKSIEMFFDVPPKFPTIQADRDRLAQAMHNLVGNAIKYTPSGGRVDVRVDFSESGGMVFEVRDNGIGIDETQHERIFERFCRADDRRIAQVTGSGIGLSLAREIARLHGGDVTVQSEINEGSTFTLTIPGAQEMSKAA